MKRISVFLGALVLALGLFALAGCLGQQPTAKKQTIKPAPATGSKSASVKIVDFSFGPAEVNLLKGGKVTWTNGGTVQHTVTAEGRLQTARLRPATDAHQLNIEYEGVAGKRMVGIDSDTLRRRLKDGHQRHRAVRLVHL